MNRNPTISAQDPTQLFEILAKLGEGSYGSVFKALDRRDDQIVAIKILEVENEDTADLKKEIAILKECKSPYIVGYKGSFEKNGKMWIVMEYCGAGSLCDLMAICEQTLTEDQIAVVMKMSLHGLSYLHSARKIHRDIKSGNILLNHAGDCKLADFGVSAELTTTMAKRKTVIGTPYWMAPEVLKSLEYNGKADIWSLAITAIELATGEPPHSNVHPMRAIFMIPNCDPPTLPNPSEWSREFKDFLRLCLQKDPTSRPSADWLLKRHPFITRANNKAVIADLVDECMQEIDEYREAEKDMSSEADSDVSTIDDSTLYADRTLVANATTVQHDAATLVNPISTMVQNDVEDDDSSTIVRPRGDVKKTEPAYMRQMAAPSKKYYYKDAAELKVPRTATPESIQSALKELDECHQEELQDLRKFYEQYKSRVRALIALKG